MFASVDPLRAEISPGPLSLFSKVGSKKTDSLIQAQKSCLIFRMKTRASHWPAERLAEQKLGDDSGMELRARQDALAASHAPTREIEHFRQNNRFSFSPFYSGGRRFPPSANDFLAHSSRKTWENVPTRESFAVVNATTRYPWRQQAEASRMQSTSRGSTRGTLLIWGVPASGSLRPGRTKNGHA